MSRPQDCSDCPPAGTTAPPHPKGTGSLKDPAAVTETNGAGLHRVYKMLIPSAAHPIPTNGPTSEVSRMKTGFKTILLSALGAWTVLLAAAGQSGSAPANATLEAPSGRNPNASVTSTITYRERLGLTPGATLMVELGDVSLADASAPLIAARPSRAPARSPSSLKSGIDERISTPGIHTRYLPRSSNPTDALPSSTTRRTR